MIADPKINYKPTILKKSTAFAQDLAKKNTLTEKVPKKQSLY